MKKLLATILALVMALGLCSVSWAAADVAEVNGVKYTTLEAAYEAAGDNATITLLENCTSGRINLEDKSIKVDLNGHVLTSSAPYGVMFCAKNGHKISIDGTKEGSKLVGTLMITAGTDGHIEINGGTYESELYCPIYINGAVSTDASTLSVTNAVIKSVGTAAAPDTGCAVYLAGYSTSTFTGCTITAPVTGIEIRAGKLTLSDCEVTGGKGEVTAEANGNGTTVTNAAVAISQHNTHKAIEVIINGGKFEATAAVYQCNVQNNPEEVQKKVSTAINSGEFIGTVVREATAEKTNLSVSGGTFSSQVNPTFLADGLAYEVRTSAGKYNYYSDYATAVAAAEAAGTTNEIVKVDRTTGDNENDDVPFTIDYADGSGKKVTIRMVKDNFELPTLTRSGYTFKGWKVLDCEGTQVLFAGPLSSEEVKSKIFAETAAGDGGAEVRVDYRDGVTLTAVWSSNSYYYDPSTSDTTTSTTTKGSPKTFDAGVGIYAVTALLSVTGMAWAGKKRH